jgi:transposase-like protein
MVPVVGAVERSNKKRIGRVVARVAPDIKKQTLRRFAREYILPKSTIFTDEHVGYDGLEYAGYAHKRIRHTAKVYVTGDVHTNTIEGFWSTVKRGLSGVYHNVSAKYLQDYLNEYCFRYNRRDQGNLLFKKILERVSLRAS